MKIRVSKTTAVIAIFIIISASFARQVMNYIKANFGEKGFAVLIGSVFIISFSLFLFFIIKNSFNFLKTLLEISLLFLGLILTWQIKLPEEKIHILEYAVLGWFSCRDLIKVNLRTKGTILASVFCIAIGLLDEIFQAILPYRFFQFRDIALNSLGGSWGVILYSLRLKK
ncbi:MAG: VanZ family protein [Candidatus Omnitrophota bacterium]|nr:VanZ family protein [Candidatus Omnitrophota bacterium]